MSHRRILSLWFPRLAAERVLRSARGQIDQPFAVTCEVQNSLGLASLSAQASALGLFEGQPLRDAMAMCPQLVTTPANLLKQADFMTYLVRWAGKYSPWVAAKGRDVLMLDITGCSHLFGGEAAMADQMRQSCDRLRLTLRIGIADTAGAAWALAHFAGPEGRRPNAGHLSGDAIDQEARATRVRAPKRRNWERGGPAPLTQVTKADVAEIALPGQTKAALFALPTAALRLPQDSCQNLARLGIRSIGDLMGLPRRSLARRFWQEVILRLDQALGAVPEPITPLREPRPFATRLSLPDPIGLETDLLAGLDRLLPPLCTRLKNEGRGARRLRLTLRRVDHSTQLLEVELASPSYDANRIRPLFLLRLPDVQAEFGIDMLRLEAFETEARVRQQHQGPDMALQQAQKRRDGGTELKDLIGRMGAKIGMENLTHLLPADSHIPEKSSITMMAGYSEAASNWPTPAVRPLLLFPPEPVVDVGEGHPPCRFCWRQREFATKSFEGPERIAREWWLDDPAWRHGTRDYWQVKTRSGEFLWLFYARGGEIKGGWFCHGDFG